MQLTFLGTAASEGYPNAFCDCGNCRAARTQAGKSLRKRCSALIDDALLIDLGPDLHAASQQHGVSLGQIRYCIQTHEHEDHLDGHHLLSRSIFCSVNTAPRLDLYMSAGALRKALVRFDKHKTDAGLLDEALQAEFNISAHAIAPFQTFQAGPYRITSVAAAHARDIVPMLYVIERSGRTVFYATDTGPLPEETWQALVAAGCRFNVVAMDHTMGMGEPGGGHMNQTQFVAQIARMRESGLLADDARVYAHHLAHHSNPLHDALEISARSFGYHVAFDGLVVLV